MKEGGIIRDGYSEEVDTLRRAKSEGKDWLAKLESEEPAGPVGPVAPVAPLDPVAPVGPVAPRYPRGPCGPSQQQLSALLQDGACSAQQLSMQA